MARNFLILLLCCFTPVVRAQGEIAPQAVTEALERATRFMHQQIAVHGGYAWVSSADGRLSHGEGVAGPDRIWVQPPGTPAVGEAFLSAYEATGDPIHLEAARDAAAALIAGQLASGGWSYSIEFDPELRQRAAYRSGLLADPQQLRKLAGESGWHVWRQRSRKNNLTVLDDDTTPAALRFLMRLDRATQFTDPSLHSSVEYALASTLNAQYPIGAWPHNYDRFPLRSPDPQLYRIREASYPEECPREFAGDFLGCYYLNDGISLHMIGTMLLAHEVYQQPEYLDAALRGGDFLLRAQLPEPQPAWAQQYSQQMHPVWDRKFEPPAITGLESQDVMMTLMDLHEATGQERFLGPIPHALRYLRSSLLPDGSLARFYELKTNRPLYFTSDYQLTDDTDSLPDHYTFVVASKLDAIERRYRKLTSAERTVRQADQPPKRTVSDAEVASILAAQSASGGWLQPGFVRDHEGKKVRPSEGVVDSATFIRHVATLCKFLKH